MPSTRSPRAVWKARTAAAVLSPKTPASAGADSKPTVARRCWRSRTASPSPPGAMTRNGCVNGCSGATSAADELRQLGQELALAAGADEALLERAVVEDHEGGDAHDLVLPGRVGVVVDVELADGDLAGLL